MANKTRFLKVEKHEVINSTLRHPPEGPVPPFSFQGALAVSVSGTWPCTSYPVELKRVTFTASDIGEASAHFVIAKYVPAPFFFGGGSHKLKEFTVPASKKGPLSFNMYRPLQPCIISPGEGLFIASMTNSAHYAVVIRFDAVMVDPMQR